MPKLQFAKSIDVGASPARVFEIVSDLGKWKPWNPWLVAEPEAVVDVTPDGKAYHWEGSRTGEGRMSIVHEVPEKEIAIDLQFLKPFKSQSKVAFRIDALGEGSRVTWIMDGGLPFFLFFLKKMMTTMLGMDYERGLRMLKDYVELGEVPSKLELIGMMDSPFVRRTAIGLDVLRVEFEHEAVSVFSHFERFRDINPVVKAPTLVFEDNTSMMDSSLILESSNLSRRTPCGRTMLASAAPKREPFPTPSPPVKNPYRGCMSAISGPERISTAHGSSE